MNEIEIEYCVPCGFAPQAMQTAAALLEAFENRLEGIRLRTGRGGVFKVRVDDDIVYDRAREAFDLDAVRTRVAERMKRSGGRVA